MPALGTKDSVLLSAGVAAFCLVPEPCSHRVAPAHAVCRVTGGGGEKPELREPQASLMSHQRVLLRGTGASVAVTEPNPTSWRLTPRGAGGNRGPGRGPQVPPEWGTHLSLLAEPSTATAGLAVLHVCSCWLCQDLPL